MISRKADIGRDAALLQVRTGSALLGRDILGALENLWAGPLSPADLDAVELGIRAFLTAQDLFAAQISLYGMGTFDDIDESKFDAYNYAPPFGDHLLDYEFIYPESAQYLPPLAPDQGNYLTRFLRERFVQAPIGAIHQWIDNEPERVYMDKESRKSFWTSSDGFNLPTNVYALADYFMRCHQQGLTVYSTSVIAKSCNEFLFSVWPSKLFEGFDSEYRSALRDIRGPGIGVDLPALTTLLLSRARSRESIPEALRDLRSEYALARVQLWELLDEMWSAPTVRQQHNVLRKISGAANSLFLATFPERRDVLSIALKLVQGNPGAIADAADQLLSHDKPRSRVSAVSLAAKLSRDMRRDLLNSKTVLKRHLSTSELRDFGVV